MTNKYNIGDTLYRLDVNHTKDYASITMVKINFMGLKGDDWQYGSQASSLYDECEYFATLDEIIAEIKKSLEGVK